MIPNFCITLYYHSLTEVITEKELVFNASTTLTFNKIEYDRNGTPLEDLQSGDDNALSTSLSNHQAYMQGMTGMYISIDFPHLNNLCMEGDLVTIESATLQLYPVKGTYGGMYPLPQTLSLYTANKDNVTQGVITDLTGNSVQTGNLVVDEVTYEKTYYSFDLTSFLQTNLGTTGYNRQKLQLILPDNLFSRLCKVSFSVTEITRPTEKPPNLSYFTKPIKMKKILFCILALYSPVSILIAQNTTNSPTSMFGLGEISTGEGGQYAGLGGAGIALRGSNFLNTANPASLTELTEQRFQIDAGIMGSYQNYTQRGASNHSVTGNLNNLSIGCRIIPRWYGAVFLAPVSSVGYAITLDEEIAGTNGSTVSSLFSRRRRAFQDGSQHGVPV